MTHLDDDESVAVSPSVSSSVKRIPSTPPPLSWTPSTQQQQHDPPRKSLSAKYIEEKSKILTPMSAEKPYEHNFDDHRMTNHVNSEVEHISAKSLARSFENFSELNSESMILPKFKNNEASSSESEDEEHQPVNGRQLPSDLETVIIAGDGNPVRHSLLSLVMEEDIPALMEAMSERFTCEFEDLDESRPSTSSILHPPETRKERRKARQVSSIRFEETSPKVYTYLDEGSAMDKNKWEEGVHVDYATYQNIIASEDEEYRKNSLAELEKWKKSIAAQGRFHYALESITVIVCIVYVHVVYSHQKCPKENKCYFIKFL
ncbi:hypothetical protein OESDEN_00017 [Oesophagostomum dentatum]|uniref:Uncharacterized protein n=1 Tax=Oesophagostomum dentatum TaxID=61180 RepID=A0A0B1TRP4_OESDE|nr:hypothetical protein OESDEN_00017 [Oesophagostomum dentatum]